MVLQADKSAFKAKKMGMPAKLGAKNGIRPNGLRDQMSNDTLDFNKKILHASWHPRENTIAVRHSAVSYIDLHVSYPAPDCGNEQPVPVQCCLEGGLGGTDTS